MVDEAPESSLDEQRPVCIVGIAASAAGSDACCELLARLPHASGMAFVFISPVEPGAYEELRERLVSIAGLPVLEARYQMPLLADHLYVISPGITMVVAEDRFDYGPRISRGRHMPIDVFFRSLAIDQRSRAIGVTLAEDGPEGAHWLAAIKAAGGAAISLGSSATSPQSTVPQALTLQTVEEIAAELTRLGEQHREATAQAAGRGEDALDQREEFNTILALLRAAQSVDFSLYRQSTIRRRIIWRMVLHGLDSLQAYLELLREKPSEIDSLYQDILIKVTHFFRDPKVFDTLKEQVYPKLLEGRGEDNPIRIWVPGCSTGEEVYSLAISLREVLRERRLDIPVQIFATDVSEQVLERARAGLYPTTIAADVSPERLQRFFSNTGGQYRVNKSIRGMCVFAKQDIIRDPPISKVDLISCRNVLIYFEPALQKKIFPVFHHALKPSSFLLLGASESAAGFSGLFDIVDKKSRVLVKVSTPGPTSLPLAADRRLSARVRIPHFPRPISRLTEGDQGRSHVLKEADRIIMSRYAPAGVVIDAELQIVQFRGHTGPFLELSPGEANFNILKMAREGLFSKLRAALHDAKRMNAPVRIEGLRVNDGSHLREVNLEVSPLQEGREAAASPAGAAYFLVLFEEPARLVASTVETPPARQPDQQAMRSLLEIRVAQLEQELTATKEHLHTIIETQETTNEELQSANEELLSSNEELQTINEELDMAREELQSTNEELSTVNEELESRNKELSQLTDDLGNLLASVDIPIVMLNRDLRIRHFTPQAERVLNLIQGDQGRPIGHIKLKINLPDLEQRVAAVLLRGSSEEREVQDAEGRWHVLRIQPYRAADSKIEGAVLCLIDIDAMKQNPATGAHPDKT